MHQPCRACRGLCALAVLSAELLSGPAWAEGAERRSIVFVEPASEELDAALRDALTAQLSGGRAEVVFEHFTQEGAPLRTQVSEARSLAHAHDATGVFWLDSQSDKDWLLYLTEPGGERVLVRRVEMEAGGAAAAVEAVSVITRQSSDALLAGQTIGMTPVTLPPVATPPADRSVLNPPPLAVTPLPPAEPSRRSVTISAGYVGDYMSRQLGWRSGIGVGLGYTFDVGVYVAAGGSFIPSADVVAPPAIFRVSRLPVYLEGGYAFGRRRFVPSLGVRAIVELVGRHAISTSSAFTPAPDSTRAVILLAPRAKADLLLTAAASAYFAAGADFSLNQFSFISRGDGSDQVLLEPLVVRPAIEVGLTFRP